MRSRLLILMGLVLLVTSCRKGFDNNAEVTDMTLNVAPTIFGQKASESAQSVESTMAAPARIVADAMARVGTKALESSLTKSVWERGDMFGLFLTVESDGKATPISFVNNLYNEMLYDNIRYTYDGSAFGTSGVLYYPYRRAAVDLYGIYPYDSELGRDAATNAGGSKRDKTNPSRYLWSVFANQNKQGVASGNGTETELVKYNIEQSDLLYAVSCGVLPNNEGIAQPLEFKHMMSKVFVRLLVPKEFNGLELDVTAPITSAKLLNTYLDGLVDFRADSVYVKVAESTTPIVMHPCGSAIVPVEDGEGTYYYYECIGVPQWVEGGRNFFQIQVKYTDGSSSSFIMRLGDKGLTLCSGKEHTLDIVFDSKVGLRLNGSSIKDWVESLGGGGIIGQSDAAPAANSYIVSSGDELLLNCLLAGNDVAGVSPYSQKLRSSTKSIGLLWQTKSSHTTGPFVISSIDATKFDLVRIKTNPMATGGGNAVIAAYDGIDGTGKILWSWHVWVIDQKIELQVYGDNFTSASGVGNAIMDRNLGALSSKGSASNVEALGMLYQWGRKDPFTGSTGSSAAAIAVYDLDGNVKTAGSGTAINSDNSFKYLINGGDNVDNSIANPMTFYSTNNGNWTTGSAAGMWSNFGTEKSIFDPCPAGYRVSSDGSFTDLGTSVGSYGTVEGTGSARYRVYPTLGGVPNFIFGGIRGRDGVLTDVGNLYNVHLSGESSDKGSVFSGGDTEVNPNGQVDKVIGGSVRCVQYDDIEGHLTIVAPSSISSTGGTAIIKVYSNSGWSASVAGGVGFSLSPTSGSGNGTITLTATSSGALSRMATVTVSTSATTISRTAKISQVPTTTTVAGIEWCNFNLTGDDGQSTVIKLEDNPQGLGKFFKWGDAWVYGRVSSSTDGDWTTNTSGASTTPSASYTEGIGNDHIFGLSGGRASGDPCQKLGVDYYTPTIAQWKALYGTGSKIGTYQGVNGVFIGANAQTCNNETIQGECIFLPASGRRVSDKGVLLYQGDTGSYWSSTAYNADYGYYSHFAKLSSIYPEGSAHRVEGASVRCIRNAAPELVLPITTPGETISAAGRVYVIAVGASGAWNTTDATNVTVTPSSGTGGNVNVKITIAANTAISTRDVSVKFNTTSGTPVQSVIWAGKQASSTPETVSVGGSKWFVANLTGIIGTNSGHSTEASPHNYGAFFKWGTTFIYQRESSTGDGGGWINENSGAATSPAASSTTDKGYDYLGLAGGTNPGDPCQKLNVNYKTPTVTQWEELYASGHHADTYNNIKGWFIGPKHSSCTNTTIQPGCIFIPNSGRRVYRNGSLEGEGVTGFYWSSTAHSENTSYNYSFDSGAGFWERPYRGYGYSVRCVDMTPAPAQVVEIAGTKWATTNLAGDANTTAGYRVETSPQGHGSLFKWGALQVYGSTGSTGSSHWSENTTGAATSPTTSGTYNVGYDYVGLGGNISPGDPCRSMSANYRTPTRDQWVLLYESGSKGGSYNGVAGCFVGPNASSCNDNSIASGCIFLPLSGYRNYSDGIMTSQGSQGRYWSSSVSDFNYGYCCYLDSRGIVNPENSNKYRASGFSVRCVQYKPTEPGTVTISNTKWTTGNLSGTYGTDREHAIDAPQHYGAFFKWGSTYVYGRANNIKEGEGFGEDQYTRGASTNGTNTGNIGYDYTNLEGSYYSGDPCQKLGSNYKTPTKVQWKELHDSGYKNGSYFGAAGYFFGPDAANCNIRTIKKGCIFLPLSGARNLNDGSFAYEDIGGWYWSSSVLDANNGQNFLFGSDGYAYPGSFGLRAHGFSVRCIQE